jgi:dihydroneopterin aldolase
MDRIALRGIVAHGRHGANPGEQDRPQAIAADVVIDVDLSRAAATDDLSDTVDYAMLHAHVVALIETHSYALLERLGAVILEHVMGDSRIRRAEVTLAKPQLLAGATPSVTLVRER